MNSPLVGFPLSMEMVLPKYFSRMSRSPRHQVTSMRWRMARWKYHLLGYSWHKCSSVYWIVPIIAKTGNQRKACIVSVLISCSSIFLKKCFLRSLEREHTGCSGLNRCNGCAGKPFHRRWFIIDEERIPGSSTTRVLSDAIWSSWWGKVSPKTLQILNYTSVCRVCRGYYVTKIYSLYIIKPVICHTLPTPPHCPDGIFKNIHLGHSQGSPLLYASASFFEGAEYFLAS